MYRISFILIFLPGVPSRVCLCGGTKLLPCTVLGKKKNQLLWVDTHHRSHSIVFKVNNTLFIIPLTLYEFMDNTGWYTSALIDSAVVM